MPVEQGRTLVWARPVGIMDGLWQPRPGHDESERGRTLVHECRAGLGSLTGRFGDQGRPDPWSVWNVPLGIMDGCRHPRLPFYRCGDQMPHCKLKPIPACCSRRAASIGAGFHASRRHSFFVGLRSGATPATANVNGAWVGPQIVARRRTRYNDCTVAAGGTRS